MQIHLRILYTNVFTVTSYYGSSADGRDPQSGFWSGVSVSVFGLLRISMGLVGLANFKMLQTDA